MKQAIANQTYGVLCIDEELSIVDDDDGEWIDQYKDEKLEVWKTRDDGYHFVYCNRMLIGYWVNPALIDIN